MRPLILFVIAAGLLAACAESAGEPSATAEPGATEAPEPTEVDQADIDIPDDLEERLVRENAKHYTLGCVYSYDFTEEGYTLDGLVQGLPVPVVEGERWAVGTLGYVDLTGTAAYLTLYVAEGDPTNATEFTRIDEPRRACFLPVD